MIFLVFENVLPKSLKILKFGNNFNQIINRNNLPTLLKQLSVSATYNNSSLLMTFEVDDCIFENNLSDNIKIITDKYSKYVFNRFTN